MNATPSRRAPDLSELIDLEAQLRADAELDPQELHARDGAIGARIGAADLDDRAATLHWLAELRAERGPGREALQRYHQLQAALIVVGFGLGVLSVGGWLATSVREPLNVVYFWPVFVGSQILLGLGFWLAIAPGGGDRLPLLGGFHALLRGLAGAIPRLMARIVNRVSGRSGEAWADAFAELRRLDWVYGGLRFWLGVQLTQLFAVAFNVGALAAFVVLPTIDDPAFGWRSRLLDERRVEAASAVVALPWRSFWPEAVPTSEVVRATRYSSVAERYVRPEPRLDDRGDPSRPWGAWWPFLVASLGCYGLLPRVVYLGLAGLRVRRARRDVPFDRVELRRLVERMRWPVLRSTGVGTEAATTWPRDHTASGEAAWPAPERTRAFCWAGLDLDEEWLRTTLADRFGSAPAALYGVGELSGESDETALAALEAAPSDEGLFVVVQAWEPPVGDHVDLLDTIRARGGAPRPVLVVLHGRDAEGRACAPESRHLALWQRAVHRRGDPRLFVAPLVAREDEP